MPFQKKDTNKQVCDCLGLSYFLIVKVILTMKYVLIEKP